MTWLRLPIGTADGQSDTHIDQAGIFIRCSEMNPVKCQGEIMCWDERHVYMMLGPTKTWPLQAVLIMSSRLTCGKQPKTQSWTLATLSLSLSCPPESMDLNPSLGFKCHLYISPKSEGKFTILLPESACPPSSWPHFSHLHYHSSVWAAPNPSLILESFSFPPSSISPQTPANISFHLSTRHTWPLLYALHWCNWDNIWRY